MAFTHALSTNNYGPARLIVATSAANGTHTTLASAMADAVSGDTIFLRDSVTENVTLTAGVNIASWKGGSLNTPTIIGTLTMTTAGTCNISGVRLQTNSANLLAVTGSAASVVNLFNCYLNCTNNTGISYTSSNASSSITIMNSQGDLGTTGIGLFANTSTGLLRIINSDITNTGTSLTASTSSAGGLQLINSTFNIAFSTSSTASYLDENSIFATPSVTCVTINGSGNSNSFTSSFFSSTASAISIGSGAIFSVFLAQINSSNTNIVTGAGTYVFAGNTYTGASTGINVTTITPSILDAGQIIGRRTNTAPAAGMIGEQIRATVGAGAPVSVTTNTATNITSISLTPGIWDVSMVLAYSAGAIVGTSFEGSISTTTATRGTLGDNNVQVPTAPTSASNMIITIPSFRVSLAVTTSVFLVAFALYTVGSLSAYGRISATRVA